MTLGNLVQPTPYPFLFKTRLMNEERAKEILGDRIQADGGLFDRRNCINYFPEDPKILLAAEFDVEELEAIVWWMRHHAESANSG